MDIVKNMVELAEFHSKAALENRNLNQISQNLKIVKQAIEIACLLEPKSALDSSSLIILEILLASIPAKIKRAACWRLYVSICKQNGLIPPPKSVFFEILHKAKFSKKVLQGDYYIVPPNAGQGTTTEEEIQSEFERRLRLSPKSKSLPLLLAD
jgi:hypothetical protein